jgi:hypothetical protein
MLQTQVNQLSRQIESLSPEAQKLIANLVELLSTQQIAKTRSKTKRVALRNEAFIGMWKDRTDMVDSVEYVRKLRQTDWKQ